MRGCVTSKTVHILNNYLSLSLDSIIKRTVIAVPLLIPGGALIIRAEIIPFEPERIMPLREEEISVIFLDSLTKLLIHHFINLL